MDAFNTLMESLNPRQPELEMRDVIMGGGGCAKPEEADPIVAETAGKVQLEPNPIHTSTDILAESSDYSFLETSRSNAFENGLETTNFKSVQQKEIVGDENNEENMDILDVSLDYSFLETSISNDLGDGFETTLNAKFVEPKEIVGVENNEENMDFFLDESLDYSFLDSSRSSALGDGFEMTLNVKSVEQNEIIGDENNEENMDFLDASVEYMILETSRSNAHGDGPETSNVECVEQKEILKDENIERTSAETSKPVSELSGVETSRSDALGDVPKAPNVECLELKEIMGDENIEKTSADTRALPLELSGLETSRSNAHGDVPNIPNVEPKEIKVDAISEETRAPASELSGLETSRSNAHGDVSETPNVKCVERDENNERTSIETRIASSESSELEKVEELCSNVALHSDGKSLRIVQEDEASKTLLEGAGLLHGNLNSIKQSKPVHTETVKNVADVETNKETPVQLKKRKSMLVSPENARVLRSRSQEKAKLPEPKALKIEDGSNETRKVKREKIKGKKNKPVNEFSRTRKHLKYLLQRINFEQSLIDAYAGEGWKGQSLEKIKPEKELQRARSQIFSCKLKIRDLFQCLDASLNEGKLPETLFDSEGEIDSDDIFCAKCATKDVTLINDIILCDGACDRAFHQFCLDPPLLKEDIPLGDEGWLCPGCDCKDDCLDILNDFLGSKLSILDNWEKVFPEEAAAKASGKNMDDISILQSEDSDADDDYNPDNHQQQNESNGKSEYISASGVMLKSDDSEDDDFDPIAPSEDDKPVENESSSSDFTSDSEDLGAILEDKDEGCVSSSLKPTVDKVKGQSLSNELSYLVDSNVTTISWKRHVERLDYKKLHDETYGGDSDSDSDSSDEEFVEKTGRKRRKDVDGIATSGSARKRHTDTRVGNQQALDIEGPKNACGSEVDGHNRSFESQGLQNACEKEEKNSGGFGSSGKSKRFGPFGEAVTQRLLESFNENQYPNKDVKDCLAKELGLRIPQVNKWFENARWSYRNTYRMETKIAKIRGAVPSASKSTESTTPSKLIEPATELTTTPSSRNGVKEMKSRKKNNVGNQLKGNASTSEQQITNQDLHVVVDTPTGQRKSNRLLKRSRS